ncbi:AbrB/MazE/SpoVT family DNA-binding domain-containing protein [Polaromonas sp.]|uniref:AbrB/MazE/SpoVT family DNA-binding domain-containing protein n=1 Tax=Polaromonas sp. TaxID=1869339 RepID=UPI00181C4D2A|nr:AbrB/MazE/SpoVT family DNA-binding domain-containing protein [Polaromonas sp.]NMM04660.1 AbrB/MazE/SpoVT family DNA-binding domain-containing protein [Polaromonas sp.]
MKKIAAVLLSVFLLAPTIASADSVIKASELSALGGLSLVAAPLYMLSGAAVLVTGVVTTVVDASKVNVLVTTEKGKETITLPKSVVDKANLKAGDQLTVKPSKSGALLSKNETPLAFLVTPENAKLSRSHELAK